MRVLVVDDEMTNRRLCQRMLQRLKCDCVCLEDGDEIMAQLLTDGYRVAVSRDGAGTRVAPSTMLFPIADTEEATGSDDDPTPHRHRGADCSSADIECRASRASGCVAPPARPFDIILLDIMMRRSNGVDVLVELRRQFAGSATPLPPVVAMTGNTSLQDLATYKQVGFVHVLGKPFDLDGLKSTLMMFSEGVSKTTS